MSSRAPIYRFGDFEFDSAQFELRNGDERTTLPVALNKLLRMFVSQPGRLFTREEIAAALWDEQGTVDTTSGVYTAIKRLRDHLGQNRSGQRVFIETAVGAGYRFVAPVTLVEEPAALPTGVDDRQVPLASLERTIPGTMGAPWRRRSLLTGLALLGVLVLGVGWKWRTAHQTVNDTALPPAWGVLQGFRPLTLDEPDDDLHAQSLSPDGKSLVWSDRRGLFVKALDSDAVRPLVAPKGLRVERIDWFPDGSAVLVSGCSGGNSDTCSGSAKVSQLWRVSLSQDTAQQLMPDAAVGTVSPDGTRLAFLRAGMTELWIANADGGSARRLVQTSDYAQFNSLVWSPRSNFIAVSQSEAATVNFSGGKPHTTDQEVEKTKSDGKDAEIVLFDAGSGAVLAHRQGAAFDSAVMLGDGYLLSLTQPQEERFRLTARQIDIEKGSFRSADKEVPLEGSLAVGTMNINGQLSASRDGRLLSLLLTYRGMDFAVADLVWNASRTHPVLEHVARPFRHAYKNYPTAWSLDGQLVVFEQGFDGPNSVIGQKMDGSGVISFAPARSNTDMFAQGCFSPDGRWLLFTDTSATLHRVQAIKRVPASGGKPETVPVRGLIDSFRCSGSATGRCVLRQVEDHRAILYYALDPIGGQGEELARIPWQPTILGDWSVSPNGRTVAMANHDPAHPSIQLIELPPDRGGTHPSTAMREIALSGFGTVLNPNWSSDGRGFFVQTLTDQVHDLLYVDLSGKAMLLRQSADLLWAEPSPDGKKIFFPASVPPVRSVWLGALHLDRLQ